MNLSSKFAAMVGNLLEHYDTALFGLLAPFLAPLFFPDQDPLTALILTYGILPLGLFVRPLGAIFFGWLTDALGCKKTLFYSLFGTAIITLCMGFLPTYEKIGILAPILLALARMLQGFFAAGESTGGILFLLERTSAKNKSLLSSFYDVTSMAGGMLASLAVALLSTKNSIHDAWRFLFFLGGATALFGLFIRYFTNDIKWISPKSSPSSFSFLCLLKEHKKAICKIALACGFSHITYSFAFTFMNGFIPLITHLSKEEMVYANTKLLIWDMCLLPCFGVLAHKIGKEKVMIFGALGSALFALPLFSLLKEDCSLQTIFLIRISIVILGTAFAAPYYAWAVEQVPLKNRCLILALGANIGSQLLAAPSQSICLWLFKITHWKATPSIYFILLGSLASYIVIRSSRRSSIALSS